MNYGIFVLSCVGFAICVYGWWVEYNLERDARYKAACDISQWASCSKAFHSPYARLFGFSNVYKGMIFYALIAILTYSGYRWFVLTLSVAATIVSLFLAYVLLVRIQTFCPICLSIYAINVGLLLISICDYM